MANGAAFGVLPNAMLARDPNRDLRSNLAASLGQRIVVSRCMLRSVVFAP